MPKQVEVNKSNLWKSKYVIKIEELKTIEKTMDWSFSTPYKGSVIPLNEVDETLL